MFLGYLGILHLLVNMVDLLMASHIIRRKKTHFSLKKIKKIIPTVITSYIAIGYKRVKRSLLN